MLTLDIGYSLLAIGYSKSRPVAGRETRPERKNIEMA